MTRPLDVTVPTAPLADALARISRLLPARSLQPARAGLLVRADADGLLLIGGGDDLTVRVAMGATTHDPGEVVVSRRGLTDTVSALAAPEVRLAADGSRLAMSVPGARFALPLLGCAFPAPAELPTAVGTLAGAELCAAAVPVAGAASREHVLPAFTGLRLRSSGGRLSLLATDRYRLASASVRWQRVEVEGRCDATADISTLAQSDALAPTVDALVPATIFAEAAKQAGRAEAVVVHAAGDLLGLAWEGSSIVTTTLSAPFPDAQLDRLLDVIPECVIEVDADALAVAVDRASRYAGADGRVAIEAIDGALLVRASDVLNGESEETVKATVQVGHVTRFYQARLLSDALRAAARHTVAMRIQAGPRATEFTTVAGATTASHLRYLVVPMQLARAAEGVA